MLEDVKIDKVINVKMKIRRKWNMIKRLCDKLHSTV